MFNYILAYLLGTIPSGFIIAKLYKVDLTNTGSGNPGATNVARTIGKKAGIITLILDVIKGSIAASLPGNIFLLGLLAIAGHCFSLPPFLKGGKGVATSLGTLLIIDYRIALFSILVFAISFYFSRIVSLSSIVSALSVIFVGFFIYSSYNLLFLSLMPLIIIFRHYPNIIRLISGEEKKFQFKS